MFTTNVTDGYIDISKQDTSPPYYYNALCTCAVRIAVHEIDIRAMGQLVKFLLQKPITHYQ